ncbi:MAG: hypothetical protein ACYS80_27520, partial [Planctomycetota bacterium]
MNPRLRRLRFLVWVMLFFCVWQFGELYNYAYAFQHGLDGPDRAGAPVQTAAGDFENSLNGVNSVLEKLVVAIDQDADVTQDLSDLSAKMDAITPIDKKIRDEFKQTEQQLKDAGLPPEILKRHRDMVKHYEDNFTKLQDEVTAI